MNRLGIYTKTLLFSDVKRDNCLMYWVIHVFNMSVFRAFDITLFKYIQTRTLTSSIKVIICTKKIYTLLYTIWSLINNIYYLDTNIRVPSQTTFNYCKTWYWKKNDTTCSITITINIAHLWLRLGVNVCPLIPFLFYLLMIQHILNAS